MSKVFIILASSEDAQPINIIIQHATNLVRVKTVGTTTLKDLQDAMNIRFSDDDDALAAVKDFIDFQLEEGATLESVLQSEEDQTAATFWHFDLRTNK